MKRENNSPELFMQPNNSFIYKGKRFIPAVFRISGDFFSITRNCGTALLEKERDGYDWTKFYKASGDSDYDLFKCLDDGNFYLPCENYLFEYRGKEAHQGKTRIVEA